MLNKYWFKDCKEIDIQEKNFLSKLRFVYLKKPVRLIVLVFYFFMCVYFHGWLVGWFVFGGNSYIPVLKELQRHKYY